MASGVTVLLFLAIASQVSAQAPGEACASPGALREEPSWGGSSVCAASGDGYEWTPVEAFEPLAALETRAKPDCTNLAGQWVCDKTCSSNGLCLDDGDWIPVQDCTSAGLVCLNNVCSAGTIDSCPGLDNMQCLDSGTYPSLIDCSLYYLCDSSLTGIGIGTLQTCPPGYFYDACLKECGISANGTCPWVASNPCAVPGSVGIAPNNDRLYYLCVLKTDNTTYPLWRKCPSGHFNLTTRLCERANEPGCGSGNQTTTTTTENSGGTTTTVGTNTTLTPPSTTTAFYCSRPGINANPATNCSFYYCYLDGSYVLRRCADGYHFDRETASCILGQCTP